MDTGLVTQVVILLTAIVGLYKAATYTPKGASDPNKKPSAASEVFDGLLSFAGMFGFMLIMPAFVWVFTAITSSITQRTSSDKTPTPQYSVPYEFGDSLSRLELSLIASSQIPYDSKRSRALAGLIERALKECDVKISIAAAEAIPYESERTTALESIVKRIDGCGRNSDKELNSTEKSPAISRQRDQ